MLRKLATVSGLTFASRLLGLLRDVVLAATLGAGPIADAFMVAFRLPNHFRSIFAEGAFNAAFLPIWAATDARGVESTKLGAQVLGWLTAANLTLLALALAATGSMLTVLAPGLSPSDPTWSLTVTLTQITFPYLFCMALVTFFSALMNSRDRFAVPAGAPILLNLCMICAMLWVHRFPSAAHAAAWGVLMAGVAQVVLLAVASWKSGIAIPAPRLGLSVETRQFFRRLGPAILTSGALQVAVLADTVIATFLPAGSLAHLYYADRLYQLPIGLIGVALGTVVLPDIGRRAGLRDEEGMRRVLDRALLICIVLGVPMTVFLGLLGDWAIQILFVRGAFGVEAARASAAILAAYSLGLVPALAVRSLVAAFHGRGDTRSPLRLLAAATAVNLALKVALAPSLGAVGLALGTSAGIGLYAMLLFRTGRAKGYIGGPRPGTTAVIVATGVVVSLAIVWLRSSIFDTIELAVGDWALPLTFALFTMIIAAAHGAVTALALTRNK